MADIDEVLSLELQSLAAIFANDFVELPRTPTAWAKYAPPAIRIKLACTEDDLHSRYSLTSPKALPRVTLHVEFSKGYPRVSPVTRVVDGENINQSALVLLDTAVRELAKQLAGSEMVYDLAMHIKERLPSFFISSAPTTSLEEEREARIEQEIAEQERQALLERERSLEHERHQAEAFRSKISSLSKSTSTVDRHQKLLVPPAEHELIHLTSPVDWQGVTFDTISQGIPIDQISYTCTFLTHIAGIGKVVIKKVGLAQEYFLSNQAYKAAVARAESHTRQSLHQQALPDDLAVANIGYHIENTGKDFCHLLVLQPYLGPSMQDVLCIAKPSFEQARFWLLDLVNCLAGIHRQGRLHGRIKASKVFFISAGDQTRATLADVGYLDEPLRDQDKLPAVITRTSRVPLTGKSEELARLVLIFLQCCTGQDYAAFESIEILLSKVYSVLPADIYDFAQMALIDESTTRMTSADLLNMLYLRGTGVTRESLATKIHSMNPQSAPSTQSLQSRYIMDFDELSKLGQGGFGAVFKARNRLDGRLYAIKKISNFRENHRLLREVSGLARLNHSHIVRYFSAWLEEDGKTASNFVDEESLDTSFSSLSSEPDDFMSSSGLIEFAHDEPQSPSAVSVCSEQTASIARVRTPTVGKVPTKTLYIQMELCPHATLRDLIDQQTIGNNYWTYFGQVAQAIAYLHAQGMIHRDLKPANIFISEQNFLKLGDFGLATESQAVEPSAPGQFRSLEQTTDFGTFLYSAPEVLGSSGGYDSKVDIYAMGIILAEMVCTWSTAMERIQLLRELRRDPSRSAIELPRKPLEKDLITMMLQHSPEQRPSAQALIELLPPLVERDQIVAILRLLDQDESCKKQILAKLFEPRQDLLADFTFDEHYTKDDLLYELRSMDTVVHLTTIFRAHAALPRATHSILPAQDLYAAKRGAVRLLDTSGRVVQMPFDLSLPWSRKLARSSLDAGKTYAFGRVARLSQTGSAPRYLLEADFDIAISDGSRHLAFAEVLQTALEVAKMDCFSRFSKRILLGHADIVSAILAGSSLDRDQSARVASTFIQLARKSSRMPLTAIKRSLAAEALPEIVVQELSEMIQIWQPKNSVSAGIDFLRRQLDPRLLQRCLHAIEEIADLSQTLEALGIDVSFDPLGGDGTTYHKLNFRLEYGQGSHFEVLCQGGFYESFAANQVMPGESLGFSALVGFSLAVDKITRLGQREDSGPRPQCFALVVTSDLGSQRTSALFALLQELWQLGVPADYKLLESSSTDEAVECARARGAGFLILFREKRNQTHLSDLLKIRNLATREQHDVLSNEVPAFMLTYYHSHLSKTEMRPSHSQVITLQHKPDVAFVTEDEHRKMKLPQRQFIASKAVDTLESLVKRLTSGDVVILVVDFDEEQLVMMSNVRLGQDAHNKRILDKFDAQSRPQAHNTLSKIEENHQSSKLSVIYSFRISQVMLIRP